MQVLSKDVKYGIRLLARSPGFTALAVLSLALGIGANTSIFSLVNTVLLRPLPIDRPDQVVSLLNTGVKADGGYWSFSYPNYVDFRDRNQVLSGLSCYRFLPFSVSRDGRNERIWGYVVSGDYFDMLGVEAVMGRTFSAAEDRTPLAAPVAVVSYDFWRNNLNADPGSIGQAITLNGHSFTVLGVAPKNFNGTMIAFKPEVWVPAMMQAWVEPGRDWLHARGNGVLQVVGRLRPGVPKSEAEASLRVLAGQLAVEYPDTNEARSVSLGSPELINPNYSGPVIGFAGLLMGAVALLLLIACANLASLLLARSMGRRKEIAIRLALGASRFRLVRQLVTESMMLSIAGGIAGLFLALLINDTVVRFKPPIGFSLNIDLRLDRRVMFFTVLATLITGIVFGLVPALQATKPDLVPALKDEATLAGYRRARLRSGLVIAQVAVSLVLLIGSSLVLRSLVNAQSIDPGFDPRGAIALSMDVGLQGYDKEKGQAFYKRLLERVRELPGISAAGSTSYLPMSLNESDTNYGVEGQPPARAGNAPNAMYSNVSPDYFKSMGIPMLEGREFGPEDKEGSRLVVIINEALARRAWPGQSAIGKRLELWGQLREVIGVAKTGKYMSLGESPQPVLYFPLLQAYDSNLTLVARVAGGDPRAAISAIREEVRKMDQDLPVFNVKTLAEHMGLSLFAERVAAVMMGSFGALALLLAAIGLFSVIAYSVSQRTREIGIRMALGARAADVLKPIIVQALVMTLTGVAIGLGLAVLFGRAISGLLYGISATDPVTYLMVPLVLAVVAGVASYIPARKAAKVDPMAALRYE